MENSLSNEVNVVYVGLIGNERVSKLIDLQLNHKSHEKFNIHFVPVSSLDTYLTTMTQSEIPDILITDQKYVMNEVYNVWEDYKKNLNVPGMIFINTGFNETKSIADKVLRAAEYSTNEFKSAVYELLHPKYQKVI